MTMLQNVAVLAISLRVSYIVIFMTQTKLLSDLYFSEIIFSV